MKLSMGLDRLPTELILIIFDNLSNNEIIYSCFFLNRRFQNIILENKSYFNYFEMPTKNVDKWKRILLEIGPRLECLHIYSTDLLFSLNLFSNIKSLIISLPFNYTYDDFNFILNNIQFQNLHSFQIKENDLFSNRFSKYYPIDNDLIYKKIFINNNSLNIFQCSLMISSSVLNNTKYFESNYNLHTLKIILNDFQDIFILILFTPNLEYLNIQCPSYYNQNRLINRMNIKLKQLDLTICQIDQAHLRYSVTSMRINQLINDIMLFSTSLTYLSINLVEMNIETINDIPFNSLKLQQFFESMIELKQFHLYAKFPQDSNNQQNILSKFHNQYWIDHNCTFGMHGNYFYTLPFHFDYLYEFPDSFDSTQCSNSDILINDPRIWSNVESIQLSERSQYDMNFIQQLKENMPRLKLINFDESLMLRTNDNQIDETNLILANVKTIKFQRGSIDNGKKWFISRLLNLNRLILSKVYIPAIDNQLLKIFDERIEYLDIDSSIDLEQFEQVNYKYFSNLQYINIYLYDVDEQSAWYSDIIMKIFEKFPNLNILAIYTSSTPYFIHKSKLENFIIRCLDTNQIKKYYQIKHFRDFCLFIKNV